VTAQDAPSVLRVGTRGSELARRQAAIVIEALQRAFPALTCEIRVIETEGDAQPTVDLSHFEGQGTFVRRIELALLAREVDVAVHSFKDMPSMPTPGLTAAAFLAREDPRDALVSHAGLGLADLPPGSVVGTGSPRRRALLLDSRPDLEVRNIRGNVDTRLRHAHAGEYGAVVLAAAGLRRLGREAEIAELMDPERFIPAVGQGILAVQVRTDDERVAALVRALDDPATRPCALSERAVALAVAAGCQTPLGAHARTVDGVLRVSGFLATGDGAIARASAEGDPRDAEALGTRVGRELLAASAPHDAAVTRPLAGRTILVTRPAGQAARLVDALRAEGADAVEIPAIAIEPPASYDEMDAAIRRGGYAWVVFTSANGVRSFSDRLEALGESASWFSEARIAAIGPETARSLQAIGATADLIPDEYVAEALVACLADTAPLRGQRILLPRADIARDALSTGLIDEGALVDTVVGYRTVAAPASADVVGRLASGQVDVVTFTSSSTVRAFVQMLEGATDVLRGTALACIGPITAQTVRDAGLEPTVVAQTYTVAGLVEALRDHYAASVSETAS
jgi:hydroxymethylbilane synthase